MKKSQNEDNPYLIAGPCAVESFEMFDEIVHYLTDKGVSRIRAGIFKPRTKADDFQGLGLEGLEIVKEVKKRYHITVISEIVDIRHLDRMLETVDILQVGARNMQNFELLKELGRLSTPILLKRGSSATIHEFMEASRYISNNGNYNILMCERGIRSFDTCTRNLLDLSCVALVKQSLNYPVIVDVSHSLGRKDIIYPMAKAAFAAGADGIMVEVHNDPFVARSDAKQQLDFEEFDHFYEKLIMNE